MGKIYEEMRDFVMDCERCHKAIYDGDTYCLVTSRKTEEEKKVCFDCGFVYGSTYEVITLEAIKEGESELREL